MTAYVLWGLTLAREAGIEVKPDVAERAAALSGQGVGRRRNELRRAGLDVARPFCYHASQAGSRGRRQLTSKQKPLMNLWTNRDRLNAYTRALLALSAHYFGYADQAQDAG